MVNQFTRGIPLDPPRYEPTRLSRLDPMPTGAAQFSEQTAAAFNELADLFGRQADRQTQIEGRRAGLVAGAQDNFRPNPATTLRAQAFNEAGVSTYADLVEARVRRDMLTAADQHADNPAALTQAFDALRDQYRKDVVFPEIDGAFQATFERLRAPFEAAARDRLDGVMKDRRVAALIERQAASETMVARITAGGADTPEAKAALDRELDGQITAIDEQEQSGTITATQAAKARAETRRAHAERIAKARIARLPTPDAVRTEREKFAKDFADGKADIDADTFDRIDGAFREAERSRRASGATERGVYGAALKSAIDRAADGVPPTAAEIAALTERADQIEGGPELLAQFEAQRRVVDTFRARPLDEQAQIAADIRAKARASGNPADAELADFADKHVAEGRRQAASDPLGYGLARGIIPQIAPVDPGAAPDVLAGQIAGRLAQARAVARELGQSVQVLRPEEKDRLAAIAAAGGDAALAMAQGVVRGAGPDATRVLAEISKDAPELATAGALLASGGSVNAARDVMDYRRLKASGDRTPELKPADVQKWRQDFMATALAYRPEDATRIADAAQAIATVRLQRRGMAATDPGAAEIYRDALEEAMGAVKVDGRTYGGVADYKAPGWWVGKSKVAVPQGIAGDKLPAIIDAMTEADLAALPVAPRAVAPTALRMLKNATPVVVGEGYRFATGDPGTDPKWLDGADGRPLVVPFSFVTDRLAPRVRGARLGER